MWETDKTLPVSLTRFEIKEQSHDAANSTSNILN